MPLFNSLLALPSTLPADHRRVAIQAGPAGTEQTIAQMRAMVSQYKRDINVRQLAGQIVRFCASKDYFCYASALHQFCRDKIRYAFDPNKVELVESPLHVIKNGVADCDSICVCFASLAENLGLRTRFVTIKADASRPDEFSHVYAKVLVPQSRFSRRPNAWGWFGVDCTMPDKPFGWEPPGNYARKEYPGSLDESSISSPEVETPSAVRLTQPTSASGLPDGYSGSLRNTGYGLYNLGEHTYEEVEAFYQKEVKRYENLRINLGLARDHPGINPIYNLIQNASKLMLPFSPAAIGTKVPGQLDQANGMLIEADNLMVQLEQLQGYNAAIVAAGLDAQSAINAEAQMKGKIKPYVIGFFKSTAAKLIPGTGAWTTDLVDKGADFIIGIISGAHYARLAQTQKHIDDEAQTLAAFKAGVAAMSAVMPAAGPAAAAAYAPLIAQMEAKLKEMKDNYNQAVQAYNSVASYAQKVWGGVPSGQTLSGNGLGEVTLVMGAVIAAVICGILLLVGVVVVAFGDRFFASRERAQAMSIVEDLRAAASKAYTQSAQQMAQAQVKEVDAQTEQQAAEQLRAAVLNTENPDEQQRLLTEAQQHEDKAKLLAQQAAELRAQSQQNRQRGDDFGKRADGIEKSIPPPPAPMLEQATSMFGVLAVGALAVMAGYFFFIKRKG